MNGSISMTLDAAFTRTTVDFSDEYDVGRLTINLARADQKATVRAGQHLDHLRKMAGVDKFAKIVSENSFPTGAGIASSASGFAALTVAACAALGLDLSAEEMSRMARLGSGSACRSIDGGFVEWLPGGNHQNSFARPLATADHWPLVDIIAIVSQEEKDVGSTAGHPLAHTSPFYKARLAELQRTLPAVRKAILEKDFPTFGELIEAEAISLHVAAMTSNPRILYWNGATVELMHALKRWREEPHEAPVGYFTIDAGPNIHVICRPEHADELEKRLNGLGIVQETLRCNIGPAARTVDDHLF